MGADDSSLDPAEAIRVVGQRADFLRLLQEGPKHKPVIQEDLDRSRSTVYKAIRELEEIGAVQRVEAGYELTLTGRLLLEKHDEFHAEVESICEPGPLLSLLPGDADLTVEVLEEATTVTAAPHSPNLPVFAFNEMIREAITLRGTSSVVLPQSVEIVHERTVAGELSVELILERPVIEHLTTNFSEQLREAVETGNVTILEAGKSLAYGLVLTEEPTPRVGIVVYGPDRDLKGLLSNDSERAVAWARSAWERHRENATPVETAALIAGSEDST